MKTFFAILILSISLIGIGNAQTGGKAIGDASIWTDSLGFSTTEPAPVDSVWILDVGFSNESYRIFLEGNANSPVDSLGIQVGSVRYNESGKGIDTTWGSYTGVKIAAGTIAIRMVNTATGVDFVLEEPAIQLLKISLLNHRGGLVTRRVPITINATRK